MCYIRNTQTNVKLQITSSWWSMHTCKQRQTSDLFASHFASYHINRKHKLTTEEARKHVKITILWQGKSISSNKLFGKLNCSLCMKERLEILKFSRKTPHLLINSSTEFYGACRHKPRFHRYLSNCTEIHSTDDEQTSSERVASRDSIDSQFSLNSMCTTSSTDSSNSSDFCSPCTSTEPLLHDQGLNNVADQREMAFVDV